MSFEYPQEISNDYEKLLENEKGYDVIIYAGENENIKEIRAHSLILCARSQYFCGAFSNELVKKMDGNFIFKKPNISPQLFKIILRFIYCGKVDLTKLQVPEIFKLLMAVDELDIQALISWIQEYLIISQEKFLQQNLLEILQTTYKHEPFKDLRNYCLEKIKMIFNSDKFTSLEAHLLEFLLKHDDLNLDEIEIWESLIKWGLAQERELNQDVSKWNQDDFDTFKGILNNFIPFIRFYGISSEDYYDKIKPYERILSKELRDEILKFYMVPGHEPIQSLLPRRFFDSTLINRKHVALFTNWIDKKDESAKYIFKAFPCEFKLLYRAGRDGNTASAFHDKCDDKLSTIVIAKITNSEQIVGGYNPLDWNGSDYKFSNDSFIFSITNRNDLQTAKVGYIVGNNQYSVYCKKTYGPTFGRGHDLSFQYNSTTNSVSYTSSYPKIDIPGNYKIGAYNAFNIDDYEVFQVIKK